MMSKEKAIIIFTVAIDVLGLGIIIPVLPIYVESFGLSALNVTMLFSIYSMFSFLSAPFLGAVSDKIGRRPVLLISIASTSIGWFIFSAAHTFPILILGRLIDGLAAGNFSTAQSSISDLSKDSRERAANLGIIGMIFGFGFIVGPFIGGLLSKISHSTPFLFVGLLSLLNVVLAFFFLPETNKHKDAAKKIHWNPFLPLVSAIRNFKLRKLYLVWFVFNFVAVSGNSIFALYLAKVYGYNAFVSGLFFMAVGVILALNQGFLIRKFWLEKFKPKSLILMMLVFFFVGSLTISVPKIALFVTGMILTALAQSALGIAMTNEIIGAADIKARGQAVGVLSSIGSAAMIIAPISAGSLFQIRPYAPYLLGAFLSFIMLLIMRKYMPQKHQDVSREPTEFIEEAVV